MIPIFRGGNWVSVRLREIRSGFSAPFSESVSLLSRVSSSFSASPLQSEVDSLVGAFSSQAADWRSLAALMSGGLAYRMGRIGVMGLGNGAALRALSVGAG